MKIDPYSHTSTSQIHTMLGWESIQKRHYTHLISFMYKIFYNMTPKYIVTVFTKWPRSARSDKSRFREKRILKVNVIQIVISGVKRTFFQDFFFTTT